MGKAAPCGWSIQIKHEVDRDLFIAKTRFRDIQREICIRLGESPEETLKSALVQEKSYVTASALQKMSHNS